LKCLTCSVPFSTRDVIPINPSEEELREIKTRAELVDAELALGKKTKKGSRKRQAEAIYEKEANKRVNTDGNTTVSATTSLLLDKLDKKRGEKRDEKGESDGVKSLYAKEGAEGDDKKKGNWISSGCFTRYSTY
jgi:hypothetical protein